MPQIRIKNWAQYQHYKDRNPPWIKLHFELLSSRDWVTLADASRVLAVVCMLVASRTDGEPGEIPDDPEYLTRLGYLNEPPDFKPLIKCGFLEVFGETLADASTMHTNARPEAETETETERDHPKAPKKQSPKTDRLVGDFAAIKAAYPKRSGGNPWRKAEQAFRARVKEGSLPVLMLKGVERYAAYCEATEKVGTEYVKQAATFFGPDKHYNEQWDIPVSAGGANNNPYGEYTK